MPAVPIIMAAAAAISAGTAVYSADQQQKAQKKNFKAQEKAQAQAETSALNQDRQAREATARAKAQQPDLNVLLGDMLKPKTSATSINANQLLLGKPSLLGG